MYSDNRTRVTSIQAGLHRKIQNWSGTGGDLCQPHPELPTTSFFFVKSGVRRQGLRYPYRYPNMLTKGSDIHIVIEQRPSFSWLVMPSLPNKTAAEISSANREAIRGGSTGAAKWGLIAIGLGVAGQFLSPIYRNLTPQFKVYLQLSAMTLGGMIGAERSMRSFEFRQLAIKRRRKNEEVWDRYEGLLGAEQQQQRSKERED